MRRVSRGMGRSYVFDFVGSGMILANILNLDTLNHKIVMLLFCNLRVLHIANELLIGLDLVFEVVNSLVEFGVFCL